MRTVRIGTSGWSYPSGPGTWNGLFYPQRGRARGSAGVFDELRYYAEHFDTVEVNTTFYGPPRAEITRGWAARTPSTFEFSLKLYQKFTHPRMFKEAALARAPGAEGSFLDLLAHVTQADIDEFRAGIEPLAAAGKLGTLLAQFPASFKADEANRAYLAQLLRLFSNYALAVELRHKSWSDEFDATMNLLNGFGAALVQIDEPQFKLSIRQNRLPNVDTFYYMRLHGRNAAQWWHHAHRDDRYNYLYSGDELREFAETATAARSLVKKAYLYTNNHFSAKSVVNAVMLKAQLGEPIEGEYPPELVERYPEIRNLVSVATRTQRPLVP